MEWLPYSGGVSDLQQRYGTPSWARRRTLIVISSVVGALFLGWLTWVIVERSDPAIEAEVQSFDVVSAHEVQFKIEVRFRDDKVQGSCLFQATAADKTPVGDLNLTVAEMRAATAGNKKRWISLKTLDKATTVVQSGCTED
jgi:hypothetical protein